MSTFQVNTTRDTAAVDFRSGKDAAGHVSLRSAIMAANAKGGSNTIKLRPGMFTLTIRGANEVASATGDLDVAGNLSSGSLSISNSTIAGNQAIGGDGGQGGEGGFAQGASQSVGVLPNHSRVVQADYLRILFLGSRLNKEPSSWELERWTKSLCSRRP
jgi:hypothetical protein